MNKKGFTLVELIVVITILAVLATVAFVSFQGYTLSARDSVRMNDTKLIQKALDLELAKNSVVPYPSNYITLTAWGVVFWYQWDAWVDVLWNLWISQEVLDPLDATLYTYSTNFNRKSYQILWFLEWWLWNIHMSETFADNTTRYPLLRGTELWIILNNETHQPIQGSWADLDIQNTIDDYWLALSSWKEIIVWSGWLLSQVLDYRLNYKASCLNILKNGLSYWNGVYNINPDGANNFDVYCDMQSDWWGWTFATMYDSTWTWNLFETTNNTKITSITENISTKWQLSDMWQDGKNKDILLVCSVSHDRLKNYETPLIIHDYEFSDRDKLTNQAKAGLPFSSTPKSITWKDYEYVSWDDYGPSWSENSIYIWAAGLDQRLFMINNTKLWSGWKWNVINGPAGWHEWESSLAMDKDNYCMTAIR